MRPCIMCSTNTKTRVLQQPLCASCINDDHKLLHAVKFARAVEKPVEK